MLFIGITAMGYFSYSRLPVALYPDAEFPVMGVIVNTSSEYDPVYIRNYAAIPVEGTFSRLKGVEEINTRISSRGADFVVKFEKNVNLKMTYIELEENIKKLSASLPSEFRIQVVKSPSGLANSNFMSLSIIGDEEVNYIRNITEKEFLPSLRNIDGVSEVRISGGQQKTMEIRMNSAKSDALNLKPGDITALIQKNSVAGSFVGNIYECGKRISVKLRSEYTKAEDIGEIIVAPGPVFLKDIADISFGYKEEDSYFRKNGKETVSLILSKSPSANLIALSEKVKKELKSMEKDMTSKGVSCIIEADAAEEITESIDSIIRLCITGGFLAILILYFFLREIKTVSIIAFAIPISVLSAFYFFFLAGISINTLTLTGIALAVGMLLDNSVVVMENIFRLRSRGADRETAAAEGVKEVYRSVFTGTLTTVTVFVPFLFTDNFIVRIIGKNVGVSVVSTLALSLAVALMLIPMAIYQLMPEKVEFRKSNSENTYFNRYICILKAFMRRPTTVVAASVLIFILSFFMCFSLNRDRMKQADTEEFSLYITFAKGNVLKKSDETVRKYENLLKEIPEIESINATIYAEDAIINVKLKKEFEKIGRRDINAVKATALEKSRGLPIADIGTDPLSTSVNFRGGSGRGSSNEGNSALARSMGMGNMKEEIVIKGQNFEKMRNLAEKFKIQLEDMDNISSANISVSGGEPELRLFPDAYMMGMNDIRSTHIVSALRDLNAENRIAVKYRKGNEDYDIEIKTDEYTVPGEEKSTEERNLNDLKNLKVKNASQALIPLTDISKFNLTYGKGEINRMNRNEEIKITYSFIPDIAESQSLLDAAREEVEDMIAQSGSSPDIGVSIVHDSEESRNFNFLILLSALIIYMILASVFESFTAPIVLMFTIPLAGIGSFIALLLTGNTLTNSNVLVGFVILIGIVVNNSIILLDYTSVLRKRGYGRNRALLTAGSVRVRPILITATTTIVGMLPLAMGKGNFISALGSPFAITVIGGLASSTMLTLIVIPTLYSGFENSLKRIKAQNTKTKILQFFLCCCIIVPSWIFIHSSLWAAALSLSTVIFVPAACLAVERSLRHSRADIIPADKEIRIEIRNLVKIYGNPSKFVREWKAANKKTYAGDSILQPLLRIIPINVFLIYFSYFYQTSAFWATTTAAVSYVFTRKILELTVKKAASRKYIHSTKILKILYDTVVYTLPLFTVLWAAKKFDTPGLSVFLGAIWYSLVLTDSISRKIEKEGDAELKGVRKHLYALARKIPFIAGSPRPFKALRSVSLDMETGMFGLLGPNGAGKTTLMRIICGILEQSYGSIFINGIDTRKKREELQGLIGYLPQEFGMYEMLKVEDFLDYQAIVKGIKAPDTRKKRIEYVLKAVHMHERRKDRIADLSGGMKQRIGIALTLLHLPRILVVDEPTAGLDPRERIRFRNLLVELSKNRIVIFSTHIIEDIASSCNKVAVIDKGRVKYNGTPSDMVKIAEGVSWVFDIPAGEFDKLSKELLIVHHIRDGENVRVRCLSETPPVPYARKATPLLEDAYLWLIRNIKLSNKEELITA